MTRSTQYGDESRAVACAQAVALALCSAVRGGAACIIAATLMGRSSGGVTDPPYFWPIGNPAGELPGGASSRRSSGFGSRPRAPPRGDPRSCSRRQELAEINSSELYRPRTWRVDCFKFFCVAGSLGACGAILESCKSAKSPE